jgi:putative ATP-binding cassette transporter
VKEFFRLLVFLSQSSRRALAVAVIAGIASGATTATLVTMVHALATRGMDRRHAIAYAALCAGCFASKVISGGLVVRLSQSALRRLRELLCHQIYATSLSTVEAIGASRLQSILGEDINAFAMALFTIPGTIINAAIMIGCLVYLLKLAPVPALIYIGLMAAGMTMTVVSNHVAARYLRELRRQQDHLFKHFRGVTDGFKELKLDARRAERFFESLSRVTRDSERWGQRAHIAFILTWSFAELQVFIVLSIVAVMLANNGGAVTFSGFSLTAMYLIGPTVTILRALSEFVRCYAAFEQVKTLGVKLESMPAGAAPALAPEKNDFQRLELSGVTYSYRRETGDSFTLGPINLTLERGDCVMIVGGNGGGKTTLAKLLCGLYVPDAGSILIDGMLVDDTNRDRYRAMFDAVFSDFYLFDDVLPVKGGGVDAEIARHLSRLQLTHKVDIREGVFSTTSLSQGQRKRLALLGVLLDDRPLCLFDEWAADQDPIYKRVFYEELLVELKERGRTTILVTHDDRYFHLADRLFKLDEGRLVALASKW